VTGIDKHSLVTPHVGGNNRDMEHLKEVFSTEEKADKTSRSKR